jgi:sialidase-1
MQRRSFLSLTAASAAAQTAEVPTARHAQAGGEIFETLVCPWSPDHPRHDHSQIFKLSGDRLMLIWSEYYVRQPSRAKRTPYSAGGAGDEAPCQLTGRVSEDGGRTWGPRFTVQENIAADCVKHPNLLRLPSGEIQLFFTSRNFKTFDSKIYMRRSNDECESWGPLERLPAPEGFVLTNCDRVMRHSSGRIVLPVYWSKIYGKGDHYQAFCMYSDDNGKTWKESRNRMDVGMRGAEEPGMVELKDGSLYCILRTGLGRVYKAISRDRGETWSKPEPTALAAPQSQPAIKRIPTTGDLVILFNNNYEPGAGHSGVRNPLNSAISRDEGKTWGNIKIIENRSGHDSAYPSIAFNGKEALVTFYQRARAMSRDTWTTLKIYPIDWLYS